MKKICDAICSLGYTCEFADNGNVIFQRQGNPANTFKAREQPKKEFNPTEEQMQKWANEPSTEPQQNKLKKMGYNKDPKKLSKLEAYNLISQNEQEGIPQEEEETVYY